jgi:flavin reductase (DIM6/NTAB) family NADH-FMN oxidoreductase RutF/rubredoxin
LNNSAMFKIGYGLYVLTANENGFDNGCIVNTVIQVTSNPNRISVTVNKANKTHDMIQDTGKFNVSMLSESAPFDIFKHFGFQSGKNVNKFSDYSNAVRSANGIYYLPNYTTAFLSATVYSSVDLGTHTMFIANVTDGEVTSEEKSVTYDYYQSNIKPKPQNVETKAKVAYRCRICGYVYEGELPADFICPICKHGASDFERIK